MRPGVPLLIPGIGSSRGKLAQKAYARAAFALDARRTPGTPAAGNTIQDLSRNALRTANGSTGNAKIVQDGRGGKALRTHAGTTGFAQSSVNPGSPPAGTITIEICFRDSEVAVSQFMFDIGTGGVSQFNVQTSAAGGSGRLSNSVELSNMAIGSIVVGAGVWHAHRWVVDPSTGTVQRFYSSDLGVTWTQGTNNSFTPFTPNPATTVRVGIRNTGTAPFTGLIRFARLYYGTTLVSDFDPSRDASFTSLSWTSATTGETWTITPGGTDSADVTYDAGGFWTTDGADRIETTEATNTLFRPELRPGVGSTDRRTWFIAVNIPVVPIGVRPLWCTRETNNSPDPGLALVVTVGGAPMLRITAADGSSTLRTGGASICDGNWHTVAVVADRVAGDCSLYVDGVLAQTGALAAYTASTAGHTAMPRIFCLGGTGAIYADVGSQVRSAAIWTEALTASEIAALHAEALAA